MAWSQNDHNLISNVAKILTKITFHPSIPLISCILCSFSFHFHLSFYRKLVTKIS
jgi:hypothetical protein